MNEVVRIYKEMQNSHLRRAKFELQEYIETIYDEQLYNYWKPRIEYMIALIDGNIDIPDNLI